MSLKDKYQSALDLAKENGAEMENFHEENDAIIFKGAVPSPYVRNLIWDKFKAINSLAKDADAPAEIHANITVKDDSVYHHHTVVAGDTLGEIAKHYFDDAKKYMAIFEANKGILKDPNMIVVGQVLAIPNP